MFGARVWGQLRRARDLRIKVVTSGLHAARRGPPRGVPRVVFTPAEVEERRARVAELTAEGVRDREIARQLGISKTTSGTTVSSSVSRATRPGSHRSRRFLTSTPARRAGRHIVLGATT